MRQKDRYLNVHVNDNKHQGNAPLTHSKLHQSVPSAKDHTPFGDATPSNPTPFANAFGRSKEHHYVLIVSGKDTQHNNASPDRAVFAETDITRCYMGKNITQGLVPIRPVENRLVQAIDAPLRPCHPTHHLLVAKDARQPTIDEAHPPVTDERTTNDANNRRFR